MRVALIEFVEGEVPAGARHERLRRIVTETMGAEALVTIEEPDVRLSSRCRIAIVHETDLVRGYPPASLTQTPLEALCADLVAGGGTDPRILIRHTYDWSDGSGPDDEIRGACIVVGVGSDVLLANLREFLAAYRTCKDPSAPPLELLRRPIVNDSANALACLCVGFLSVRAAQGDEAAAQALGLDAEDIERVATHLKERLLQCEEETSRRDWWNAVAKDAEDARVFEADLADESPLGVVPKAAKSLLDAVVGSQRWEPPAVPVVASCFAAVRGMLRKGRE